MFSLLIDCAYIQDQETSPKGHVPLDDPFGAPFGGGSSPNGNYPLIIELTKYYTNWSLINYFLLTQMTIFYEQEVKHKEQIIICDE